MSVIDMAKAHLQNVHLRIEELNKQKQLIDEEINKLKLYIAKGIEDIEEMEENDEIDKINANVSIK